ncbi:MAG: putative 3-oxoacyl-(acyl-carrier-protein) synthase, partial [Firmicutes bacterium]|nr:putative 3-oxoacyl-(acyl-carrier-protein) synthase [Bacillota bacterium]
MYQNVHIVGVGSYHPEKKVENQFFIDHFKRYHVEDHAAQLFKKLGRETRTFAEEDETSLSMAVKAARQVLDNTCLQPEDIDMIISVSDTPEYLSPCCA